MLQSITCTQHGDVLTFRQGDKEARVEISGSTRKRMPDWKVKVGKLVGSAFLQSYADATQPYETLLDANCTDEELERYGGWVDRMGLLADAFTASATENIE